jgi:hypothetical protein
MHEKLEDLARRVGTVERKVDHLEKMSRTSKATTGAKSVQEKKLSLRDFLVSRRPRDEAKKTLLAGYYLEKHEGFQSFSIRDLEKAFELAKEKKPLRLNDKVNMNIRNGHMEGASKKKNNRKTWYLTNLGESLVANDFEG